MIQAKDMFTILANKMDSLDPRFIDFDKPNLGYSRETKTELLLLRRFLLNFKFDRC